MTECRGKKPCIELADGASSAWLCMRHDRVLQIDQNEAVLSVSKIVTPHAPACGTERPPPTLQHHSHAQLFELCLVFLLYALTIGAHIGRAPGKAAFVQQSACFLAAQFLHQCFDH